MQKETKALTLPFTIIRTIPAKKLGGLVDLLPVGSLIQIDKKIGDEVTVMAKYAGVQHSQKIFNYLDDTNIK